MSFLIGLLAGIFGGLVGLGVGIVMIPLMVGILKMGQHKCCAHKPRPAGLYPCCSRCAQWR